MADWPDNLDVGPIREWPGELRAHGVRERAKFMRPGRRAGDRWIPQSPMPLSRTLVDLTRELEKLRAKDVELLVAIDPSRFTMAGKPYANAKADHPGVILSFDLPGVGTVSYPCDKYTRWEDNLRAIVLSLEALRLVDRHGVTRRGEQYRGFLALEATAAPSGFATAESALDWLATLVGDQWPGGRIPRENRAAVSRVVRGAQRRTHPDHGGDAATFQRVSLAEAKLREAGLL